MASVGISLGAFGAGKASIDLLTYIATAIQKVRRLPDECREVKEAAQVMLEVLETNKSGLQDESTATRLNTLLKQLADFIAVCQAQGIVQQAWEVMWRQKLPALLKQMMMWIAFFTAEITVRTSVTSKLRRTS